MKINTKLNVGDIGFFYHEGKLMESPVKSIRVEVDENSNVVVKYKMLNYRLWGLGAFDDMGYFDGDKVYKSKEEFIKSVS